MMTRGKRLLYLLPQLVVLYIPLEAASIDKYTRSDFPADFVFGSGTSAYQYEGAAFEDGRTPTEWDIFAHSGGVPGGGNGDIASDGYHKYKEDIRLMADTGLEAYRMSISWSRLLPNGRGYINPKGLEYYNNVINELILHGIQPHVTLFHYDLPQVLNDEYGGWLNRKIVKDFIGYANVCFKEFGDRVLHWTTFNEPNIFALFGFDCAHSSQPFAEGCNRGNSSTEPYIVAHNMLLAHSAAMGLYRQKYKAKQHGFLGINVYALWFVPYTNTIEDITATQRANDFFLGWIIDPLIHGDYPDIMKKNAGKRLPSFTEEESKQIKGAFDFLAVNHYSALYIQDNPRSLEADDTIAREDMAIKLIFANGSSTSELSVVPMGLYGVLDYFKQVYGNPPIYVHENGKGTARKGILNDTSRIEYLHSHIGNLLDAVRNGSNTRGYFTWSFVDIFELLDGYLTSFGHYYVDLDDELKRYPKLSAHWYANFLKGEDTRKSTIVGVQKGLSASSSQ